MSNTNLNFRYNIFVLEAVVNSVQTANEDPTQF